MGIIDSVKEAREKSKKRKFKQSFDLCIALRNFDLNKAENKLNFDIHLPHGKGKDAKACIITDHTPTDGLDAKVITKLELNKLNKKKIKKLANEYDFFLAEASLMVTIGKVMGPVLGPRGKMPKPFPPKAALQPFLNRGKENISIRISKAPVIQLAVGSEDMDDKHVEENINSIVTEVEKRLPKGRQQINHVFIKLTMGPAVNIKV